MLLSKNQGSPKSYTLKRIFQYKTIHFVVAPFMEPSKWAVASIAPFGLPLLPQLLWYSQEPCPQHGSKIVWQKFPRKISCFLKPNTDRKRCLVIKCYKYIKNMSITRMIRITSLNHREIGVMFTKQSPSSQPGHAWRKVTASDVENYKEGSSDLNVHLGVI